MAEINATLVKGLRAKGISTAAKKTQRVAAEGLVGLVVDGNRAAIVELNAETDFVARSPAFQKAAAAFATIALAARGDRDRLLNAASPDGDGCVADLVTRLAATIGERINLRRSAFLSTERGVVASYLHGAAAPGLGRIGVIVALESAGDRDALAEIGRRIAMHIAASAPRWITVEEIPAEVVAAKRAELTEQARATGKPPQVIEKMIEGRIRKFYDEVVLMRQVFVFNLEQTVDQVLEEAHRALGATITVEAFARLKIGEGVERPAE